METIESRNLERAFRQLGLRRIEAFVRQEPGGAAVRTRKHRRAQMSRGLRQMNVIVPDDDVPRAAIRAVAARLVEEPASAVFFRNAAELKGERKNNIFRIELSSLGLLALAFAMGCGAMFFTALMW